MRWEAMMVKLRAGTIQQWFADFVEALEETRPETPQQTGTDPGPDPSPIIEPPTLWPRRTANSNLRIH
jgi:trehalose 6-phosphate synthase